MFPAAPAASPGPVPRRCCHPPLVWSLPGLGTETLVVRAVSETRGIPCSEDGGAFVRVRGPQHWGDDPLPERYGRARSGLGRHGALLPPLARPAWAVATVPVFSFFPPKRVWGLGYMSYPRRCRHFFGGGGRGTVLRTACDGSGWRGLA